MNNQNPARNTVRGRPRILDAELRSSQRVEILLKPRDIKVLPFQTSKELNRWTRTLVQAELERLRVAESNPTVTESFG